MADPGGFDYRALVEEWPRRTFRGAVSALPMDGRSGQSEMLSRRRVHPELWQQNRSGV
jgi:hypothetical protein